MFMENRVQMFGLPQAMLEPHWKHGGYNNYVLAHHISKSPGDVLTDSWQEKFVWIISIWQQKAQQIFIINYVDYRD